MDEKLKKVRAILKKYHQEHLLAFYTDLNENEKTILLDQILKIDFDFILNLYHHALDTDKSVANIISPLPYYIKNQMPKRKYQILTRIGENVISNHHFAAITLAGGQGTRLGFKGPKGTFELDIEPKKSLFEILCDQLKRANCKYHTTIPWYIMTSSENYLDTIAYFKNKNFFDYPQDEIYFFKQGKLPLIDLNGKLILEETYKIKEASNGNGNVFYSLAQSGLLCNMKEKDIRYVSVTGVDNIICEMVDPLFIGLSVFEQVLVSSKTLFKKDPTSNQWVFGLKDGKPAIIDCRNFGEQLSAIQDANGNYLYREINILCHLFHIDALEKLANVSLPYHLAFRKNAFVNEEGMKQVPDEANTYKFETFIFDALSHFDKIALLRVEEDDEFAPIKDFNGPHNPEVAKELYEKKLKIDNEADL